MNTNKISWESPERPNGPWGLMFHGFHSDKHPKVPGSLDESQFRDLLLVVLETCRILSPSEFLEGLSRNTLTSRDLIVTFDDGLLSQVDVALPVLDELGIAALFNVYTACWTNSKPKLEIWNRFRSGNYGEFDDFYSDFCLCFEEVHGGKIEYYLSSFPEDYLANFPFYSENEKKFRFLRDEVATPNSYEATMDLLIDASGFDQAVLSENLWLSPAIARDLAHSDHELGLHSFSHPTQLDGLTRRAQEREYRRNFDDIFFTTGIAPRFMAHPCGRYSSDTLSILATMGVRAGFRSSPTQGGGSVLELPREDHAVLARRLGVL